jgi:cytidylate kinase
MPSNDCFAYLKAILAKDYAANHYRGDQKHPHRERLVITISRDLGAGGELIGNSLSQCLAIPIYDREILRLIAERSKTSEFHVELHDEQVTSGLTSVIFSTITGAASHMANYRKFLYEVVKDLAQQDAILIGRGAHLILSAEKAFRIRVIASLETCVQRVMEDSGLDRRAAEKQVIEVNSQRHQSIRKLFGDRDPQACLLDNAENFDLVLNTDHISPEQAPAVILMALRAAGFPIFEVAQPT